MVNLGLNVVVSQFSDRWGSLALGFSLDGKFFMMVWFVCALCEVGACGISIQMFGAML